MGWNPIGDIKKALGSAKHEIEKGIHSVEGKVKEAEHAIEGKVKAAEHSIEAKAKEAEHTIEQTVTKKLPELLPEAIQALEMVPLTIARELSKDIFKEASKAVHQWHTAMQTLAGSKPGPRRRHQPARLLGDAETERRDHAHLRQLLLAGEQGERRSGPLRERGPGHPPAGHHRDDHCRRPDHGGHGDRSGGRVRGGRGLRGGADGGSVRPVRTARRHRVGARGSAGVKPYGAREIAERRFEELQRLVGKRVTDAMAAWRAEEVKRRRRKEAGRCLGREEK